MDKGNLGENIFSKWCHQADLIPIKASIDKGGWDFLVTLPKVYDEQLHSLDKDYGHDQILVQVKTTGKRMGNKRIKVSNLKKLVESSIPSFYLLIQVSDKGEATTAHLFHVWEKIIFNVQEKLRKTPRDQWNMLHKKKMALPQDAAQEMGDLHGEELHKLIRTNLNLDKRKYSAEKNKLIKNVGYKKSDRGSLSFTSSIPEEYDGDEDDFLVDFLLGETDKINVTNFEITDKRFDSEIVTRKDKKGTISLSNHKPEGEVVLKFITNDRRASAEITTDMFFPNGLRKGVIDQKKFKILFKNQFIKLFLYPFDKILNITIPVIDLSKKVTLSTILDVSEYLTLSNEVHAGEVVQFEIHKDQKIYMAGSTNLRSFPIDEEKRKYFEALGYANTILNKFHLSNNLEVIPAELNKQHSVLGFFDRFFTARPLTIKFKFELLKKIGSYKKIVCLIPFTVKIADLVFALQLVAKVKSTDVKLIKNGNSESNNYFYEINTHNVHLEQHEIIESKEYDERVIHQKMNDLSLNKYKTSDDVLVIHSID